MKRWLAILLIGLIFLTIGIVYLFSMGGLDENWEVIGNNLTPPINATYSFGLVDFKADEKLNIRRGMNIASSNEGRFNIKALDGRLLIHLLGNSSITFKEILVNQNNHTIKLETNSSQALTNQQALIKYPEILDSSMSLTQDAIKPTDSSNDILISKPNKIVLEDLHGLIFLEVYSPIIVQVDSNRNMQGPMIIRVVPTNSSNQANGIDKDNYNNLNPEPARILLFRPEQGIEGIIYFGSKITQERFVVEVLSRNKKVYPIDINNQLIFYRTQGKVDYKQVTNIDKQKLYQLLSSQLAWTGKNEKAFNPTPEYLILVNLLSHSLDHLDKTKNSKTINEMISKLTEWRELGGQNISEFQINNEQITPTQTNGNNTTFMKGFMERQTEQ